MNAQTTITAAATCRIYVADLAAYNNGILHGRWIDVDGKDADELQSEVDAILAASPISDAEEFAIHDHEGFGRMLEEYTSLSEVAEIAEALSSDDEDKRRGFRWLVEDCGYSVSEALSRAEDVRTFDGYPDEYAEEFVSECYPEALKGPLGSYIDFSRFGRDLVLGGDVAEVEHGSEHFLVTNAGEF